jgi:hypothetical protein
VANVRLVTIKRFTYRGTTEEWSNIYHFTGTQPANSAAWTTIAAAMKNLEASVLPSNQTLTEWYAYNDGSETADFHGTHTSSNVGTLATTGGVILPGDAAVWVRWSTGETNSRGKPIYLRKYFHGAIGTTGNIDTVLAAQKTALEAFGGYLIDGTSLAGGLKVSRPNGTIGSSPLGSTYVTTRTLKRRGKRPPT